MLLCMDSIQSTCTYFINKGVDVVDKVKEREREREREREEEKGERERYIGREKRKVIIIIL